MKSILERPEFVLRIIFHSQKEILNTSSSSSLSWLHNSLFHFESLTQRHFLPNRKTQHSQEFQQKKSKNWHKRDRMGGVVSSYIVTLIILLSQEQHVFRKRKITVALANTFLYYFLLFFFAICRLERINSGTKKKISLAAIFFENNIVNCVPPALTTQWGVNETTPSSHIWNEKSKEDEKVISYPKPKQ